MFVLAFAENVQILPDLALVVNVVVILTMIWILNRTFFRPINRVISARMSGKGGENSEAMVMHKSAAEKEQQYKDALLATRSEGYDLIERERLLAVKSRQETVAAFKSETVAKTAADLQELARQSDAAQSEISEEAKKLAEEISSNILKVA